MFELTELQLQELAAPEPIAVDPKTKAQYVLVPKKAYDRIRHLLDEDVRATGELVDKIMAEDDANDPTLASYQSITREYRP